MIHPSPLPIYVWVLPRHYNDRIVAATEAGLIDQIRTTLRRSGYFAASPRAMVLGVWDTLEGHVQRASNERRRLCLSQLGAWDLFARRQLVAPAGRPPFVDRETIEAFDDACGAFVRNTFLSRTACTTDGWPGLNEWWVEAAGPEPVVLPVIHGPIVANLTRRMANHLGLRPLNFALHVLNPAGTPLGQLSGDSAFGTFIVQMKSPSSSVTHGGGPP